MEKLLVIFTFILLGVLVFITAPHLSFALVVTEGAVAALIAGLVLFLTKAQKRSERETSKKDDEVNAIINNITDAVIVYTENFKVLNINIAALQLFSLSYEDVINKEITPAMAQNEKFRLIAQVIFPSLAPSMNQVTTEGWPQITELSFPSPLLKLRVTLCRLVNALNGVTGFMKIVHDETREKSILESKTEFITVAAHQLRTPLTAVKWSLEHILNNATEESIKAVAKEGHEVSERTLKIVNDLLDASKIEQGRFGFAMQEVDLKVFLEEIVTQAEPVAKQLGITLTLVPLPVPVAATIDPEKLGMAIFNLVDNAIRYNTEHGSVQIEYAHDSQKSETSIRIRDTGVGIPPQEINRLFSKFYRGSNVIQLQPNGSGLGLYITKNIIEAHGGKIGIESVLGRGTTFHISLPANKNQDAGVKN